MAVQRVVRPADGAGEPLPRPPMRGQGDGFEFRIGPRDGRGGQGAGVMRGDAPACVGPRQGQVDQAEVRSMETRHDCGLAVQRLGPCGKGQMGVAGHQNVAPRKRGEGKGCVLHPLDLTLGPGSRADAGMGEQDGQIGVMLPDFCQHGACTGKDVTRPECAFQFQRLPFRGLRRGKAGQGDAEGNGLARAVGETSVEQGEARGKRLVPSGQVSRDDGEAHGGKGGAQQRQAVAEFVIAERARVIAERVHRLHHRVGVLRAGAGEPVAHRAALKEIAVVQEQAVGRILAQAPDHGGELGKAGRKRPVGQIVPGHQMRVQVRGREQPQMQQHRRLRAL